MREIKFRVFFNGEMRSDISFGDDANIGIAKTQKSLPLMQYIGMKDKNGIEIYEGDIVRATPSKKGDFEPWEDFVEFDEFRLDYRCDGEPIGVYETFELEVIGNIHQNPELLKGGE